MSNILVTGGAGYVGSALVPALRKRGIWTVDVVDACILGQSPGFLEGYHNFYQTDFRTLGEKFLSQYEVVIHLAALSNDPMAHFSPDLNFEINTAGATLLAYRAKRAGVRRFVFASSASIYQGITDIDYAVPENPVVAPQEPYALSKLQAEVGLRSLSSDTFCVTIFRKGTIGGYAPRMRYDLVLNTMYKCAMQDGVVKVFVNRFGDAVMRPHLSIQTAVDWYIAAAERRTGNVTYNVLSENTNILKMAEQVCDKTGASMQRVEVTDSTLLRNYVMKKPDLRSDVRLTHHGVWDDIHGLIESAPDDYDNPSYYNIRMWEKWLKEKLPSSVEQDS